MRYFRFIRIFRHALVMVRRNLRSYIFLSVTIVLSFTMLLGFMGYMDTSLYNKYKGTFMVNRGTFQIHEGEGTQTQFNTLLAKAQELPATQISMFRCVSAGEITGDRMETSDGQLLSALGARVYFLADHCWQFICWIDEPVEIRWLDGKEHDEINLLENEAIMDMATFHALGLEEMAEPRYYIHLHSSTISGTPRLDREIRIVGLIDLPGELFTQDSGKTEYDISYFPILLLSDRGLSEAQLDSLTWQRVAIFYTEEPEQLAALARSIGYTPSVTNSAYEMQDAALEKIKIQTAVKGLIAAAILLVLGVNLYSSFSNALNERKFEIGVKRALGASGFQIVRQFLYESLTVMVVNILLSISLVVGAGLVLKVIMENIHLGDPLARLEYWDYILFLSPYSVLEFAVCAASLTVVFSLIFAYKSTQVEIVKYLKSE